MGSVSDEDEQAKAWRSLYDQIEKILRPLGIEDPHANGDYWVLDENWGPRQQRVEINNLNLLKPFIVKSLQGLLKAFPDWKIVVAVDVRGREGLWPEMGLVIRPNEIVDGLQRQYFPEELRTLSYEGSRPGTAYD